MGQALEELAAVLGVELESAEESGEAVEEDEERELAILEGERLFERGELRGGIVATKSPRPSIRRH